MAKIIINRDKCKGCLLCISFCPKGLICVDKNLNCRGIRPVKFSRQARKITGGIPSSAETESSQRQEHPALEERPDSRFLREEAGNENAECLGCAMCAIICPDCCIEVFK